MDEIWQGFNVSYSARFPFVGRNGAQLDEKYAESPYSYLCVKLLIGKCKHLCSIVVQSQYRDSPTISVCFLSPCFGSHPILS